jgi:predicted dehydrogenase
MASRRARIGVIGTGWWATYAHLPSLTSYPSAEVVALADTSPERLAQAAERFGIAAQFADYREMLDQADLDGVVVATTHVTHFAIAHDVLSRGLPLMLEKPMVLRAGEAHQLVALAEQLHTPLVIGYPYHFVPCHQHLRKRIAEGALGHLQLTTALFASMVLEYYRANPQAYAPVFQWDVTGPQPTTYSDPSVAGGGQGHLQVTHSAALLLWLTDLRPLEGAAFLEGFDLQVDLCDAISVRFDNAAVSTRSTAASDAHPAPAAGAQTVRRRRLRCSIRLPRRQHLLQRRFDRTTDETPPDLRYPMHTTSRHLVDLILGVADTNQAPGAIGARTVEVLEAAYRSAAEHRVVRIDEL